MKLAVNSGVTANPEVTPGQSLLVGVISALVIDSGWITGKPEIKSA